VQYSANSSNWVVGKCRYCARVWPRPCKRLTRRLWQLRDERLIINREKAELAKAQEMLVEERSAFEEDVKREWALPKASERIVLNVGGQVRPRCAVSHVAAAPH